MKAEIIPGFGKIDCGKDNETYFAVKVTGDDQPEGTGRDPVTVVALLDISGSMGSSGKMDGLKHSMLELVRQLDEKDRLAIIAYDDLVETLMVPTAMDGPAKKRAAKIVDGLSPRGCTDISSAMLAGYDMMREHGIGSGVNRMILFTDGCPNRGARTADELSSVAAKKPDGVQVSAMGYGSGDSRFGDIDLDILTAVADAGDGNFHYMENRDMCAKAFARELSGILTVDSVDITLAVEGGRMTGIRCLEPGGSEKDGKAFFRLPDILAGESRIILFKGFLPAAGKPWAREASVAKVVVRGTGLSGKPDFNETFTMKVRFVKDGDGDRKLAPEVEDRKATIDLANTHRAAYDLADRGDLAGARALLVDFQDKMPDFARQRYQAGNDRVMAMFDSRQTFQATAYVRTATSNSLTKGRASGGLMDDGLGK